MKLLRLAPENTKFPFMRFRRVSYPLSATLSIISVVLFVFVQHEFRHRFRRRHGDRVARQGRHRPTSARCARIAEKLDLGDDRGAGFRQ